MHMQPLYQGYEMIGGKVSEGIFKNGLCLPSGTNMTDDDQSRVIRVVRECWK